MENQAGYESAKKRVGAIRGFYQHFLVYVLVNVLLFIINLFTSRGDWWFLWPLLGWGIGIVAHAASVFAVGGLWGSDWEERKIKQLMERDSRGHDR